tara:strand:- start:136 stop:588 length:453 start_codon:yes stop_codon:yes gene_type:complete
MYNFHTLKEERFIHKTFEFKNLSKEEGFESPYIFNKYFNNISYNTFVKNITELMEFHILPEEIDYLNTFFGKKLINNTYTISKIIKKNIYTEFIDTVIICKRIEFLSDYIYQKKMSIDYLNYINNLLKSIYKTRTFLAHKIHKNNKTILV